MTVTIGRRELLAALGGAADSVLIYPNNEAWEVGGSNITEARSAAELPDQRSSLRS